MVFKFNESKPELLGEASGDVDAGEFAVLVKEIAKVVFGGVDVKSVHMEGSSAVFSVSVGGVSFLAVAVLVAAVAVAVAVVGFLGVVMVSFVRIFGCHFNHNSFTFSIHGYFGIIIIFCLFFYFFFFCCCFSLFFFHVFCNFFFFFYFTRVGGVVSFRVLHGAL